MLGKTRQNRILVGYGEDAPCEFVDWLDEFVLHYQSLEIAAHSLDVNLSIQTIEDFLVKIGLDVESTYLDRECCCGRGIFCWMKKGTLRSTKDKAGDLIAKLTVELDKQKGSDLYYLIAALKTENAQLGSKLRDKNTAITRQTERHRDEVETIQKEHDAVVCVHSKLLERLKASNAKTEFLGPFLFYANKVFAVVQVSGVPIPDGFYRNYLELLREKSKALGVEINEIQVDIQYVPTFHCPRTVLAKPTSPRDWNNVWVRKQSIITPIYTFYLRTDTGDQTVESIINEKLKCHLHFVYGTSNAQKKETKHDAVGA